MKDLGSRDTGAVDFTLRPSTLDFGTHDVGTVTTQSFWLRNRASIFLSIDGMEVQGTGAAAYAVTHACGALVAPGGVCGIHVTFKPTVAGPATAALKVRAEGVGVRTRELSGIGQ